MAPSATTETVPAAKKAGPAPAPAPAETAETAETASAATALEKKINSSVAAHSDLLGDDPFAFGGVPFTRGLPTFADGDALKKRQWQLEHMAGAFRVFARKGYTEGAAGHISVRDPVDPHTFWINPFARHFGLLRASDMVHVDERGRVIGGAREPVNTAGFLIHSAIHRAHPRVHAACHTHSKWGKAWSTFGRPLEILSQDTCTFYQNQAVYASFGGVVLEKEEGENIAAAMGDARCVILQNHGLLTVGETVDEAAYLFTLMERSCELQMAVDATGRDKIYVDETEAAFTAKFNANGAALYNDFQPDFEYEVWASKGEVLQ